MKVLEDIVLATVIIRRSPNSERSEAFIKT